MSKIFLLMFVLAYSELTINGQEKLTNFVDVVQRAKEFDGKRISVRATYRYGFENSELYCLPSSEMARVWLRYAPDLPKATQDIKKRFPKGAGTVNGIFTGIFRGTRGAYGDGGYDYQLEVENIGNVEVISKSGAGPDRLQPGERSKVCGANSK